LINRVVERADIDAIHIPANSIAENIGNSRLANMVLVGAMISARPVLSLDALKMALENHLPKRHQKLLPANFEALDQGRKFAEELLAKTIS
jgi:2-oxoglutarate ferredoxin oxidoreductase subunit gamma